jgi:hypothetical protein
VPTAFRPLPGQDTLHKLYAYDTVTGVFTYKTGHRTGTQAGCKRTRRGNKPWLILITVNGTQYAAHRLAWQYVTGKDPGTLTIDHIDQNPFNNAWSNLRLADNYVQAQNRTWWTRHTGVTFHKCSGKWVARIQQNGIRRYLGLFSTEAQAVEARNAACEKYEKQLRSGFYLSK